MLPSCAAISVALGLGAVHVLLVRYHASKFQITCSSVGAPNGVSDLCHGFTPLPIMEAGMDMLFSNGKHDRRDGDADYGVHGGGEGGWLEWFKRDAGSEHLRWKRSRGSPHVRPSGDRADVVEEVGDGDVDEDDGADVVGDDGIGAGVGMGMGAHLVRRSGSESGDGSATHTTEPHDGECQAFIGIVTRPNATASREAIRQTWLTSVQKYPQGTIQYKFFVGRAAHEDPDVEQHEEHDVVQLPFHDTYYNLSIKTAALLKYPTEGGKPGCRWIIKVDDDVYLHLPSLLRTLSALPQHTRVYAGRVLEKRSPVRDPRSKWHLPRASYAYNTFPTYVEGPLYVLSRSLVKDLPYAMMQHGRDRVPTTFMESGDRSALFLFEDVFTGELVKRLPYQPALIHLPWLYRHSNSTNGHVPAGDLCDDEPGGETPGKEYDGGDDGHHAAASDHAAAADRVAAGDHAAGVVDHTAAGDIAAVGGGGGGVNVSVSGVRHGDENTPVNGVPPGSDTHPVTHIYTQPRTDADTHAHAPAQSGGNVHTQTRTGAETHAHPPAHAQSGGRGGVARGDEGSARARVRQSKGHTEPLSTLKKIVAEADDTNVVAIAYSAMHGLTPQGLWALHDSVQRGRVAEGCVRHGRRNGRDTRRKRRQRRA